MQNPCMATLTTGRMMGGDPNGNHLSFIRPLGHRIYVPMETSFSHAIRYQMSADEEEKKASSLPPQYDSTMKNESIISTTST